MTHADFLCWLADEILLSRPHDAQRLIEVAHDFRVMGEVMDDLIGDAMDAARVEERTRAELARICKGHHGR
jgi:hypothetical protein